MTHSFSRFACIEPLESRIAPALLVNGANLLGGSGNPKTGETSLGGNEVTLIKVSSGQALVWYLDGNILGISFGPNTALEITGNVGFSDSVGGPIVFGHIVGNLTAEGRLSDSNDDPGDGEDGNVLLPNNLLSLKTFPLSSQNGDFADILTGGSISNVSVNGKTQGLYAGDGAFRAGSALLEGGAVEIALPMDVNPLDPAFQAGFSLSALSARPAPGASIKTITVQTAQGMQVFAGNGGAALPGARGEAGGSISGVSINSAFALGNTDSYFLLAGDGQSGASGGAGGAISGVLEVSSGGTAAIQAGRGGDGSAGPGGAGGSITLLELQSDSTSYTVRAGDGGRGVGGGAGGSVINSNFANTKPTNSLILTGDFTGDRIDDILVIDSSTGGMILSARTDLDPEYRQVFQHFAEDDFTKVFTIDGKGVTPIGAVATDYDGDGQLDVVVAYKNSSSLGVYHNEGGGNFWDPLKKVTTGPSVGLGFSPVFVSLDKVGGNGLVVGGNDGSQTLAHHLVASAATGFSALEGSTKLGSLATGAVPALSTAGEDFVYVAMQSGKILQLVANNDPKEDPFFVEYTGVRIGSGILNLDVDTTGLHLLALQSGAKSLALFEVGPGGGLLAQAAPDLSLQSGRPLVARFVDDKTSGADSIALLSALNSGSRLDFYDAQAPDNDPATVDAPFSLAVSLSTQPTLRNFGAVFSGNDFGVAAVGGSLSQFYVSPTLSTLQSYVLPFTGKMVSMQAGDGGAAFDSGKTLGKGGAGGNITSFNADAIEIHLTAGEGGSSVGGAGGAGGSAGNPGTFTSKSGLAVTPRLIADASLTVLVGGGGSPSGSGLKAIGGAGGSINGLSLSLGTGLVSLTTGDGGHSGLGGASAGDGGDLAGVRVLALGGGLILDTGKGGDALADPQAASSTKAGAKAGHGGDLKDFRFSLELDAAESGEVAYSVALQTGAGGTASAGIGGAGGAASNVFLKLDGPDRTYDDLSKDPVLLNAHVDSTLSVSLKTGRGGDGKTGGAGGLIAGFASASYFDQNVEGSIYSNYVVMDIASGKGGTGTAGGGGNGGGISFGPAGISGVTFFDPDLGAFPAENPGGVPLRVIAGDGGGSSTKGGLGGSIDGLVAKNALYLDSERIAVTHLAGATLLAGNGGAGDLLGGRGGDISKAVIGVQGAFFHNLRVESGSGGAAGALGVGGAGGSIGNSTFGSVNTSMALLSGHGGDGGKAGGAGGLITSLEINTPDCSQEKTTRIVAGFGGAAFGENGQGGAGGDISKLSQSKDLNSAVNLIQAGNGGAGVLAKGGRGGNVSTVNVLGFIGMPTAGGERLGAFDFEDQAQGLFVGRGGAGFSLAGLAGSASGVSARQISAIAAAVDGAGLFVAATSVSNVKTGLLGFDVDGAPSALADFDSVDGTGGSPVLKKAIDGFLLANALKSVSGTRAAFIFPRG